MYQSVNHHKYLLSLLLLAVVFFSCSSKQSYLIDHPGYLDSVFKKMNVEALDTGRYYFICDSVYQTLKNPSPGDNWERFHFKFGYNYYTRFKYAEALPFTDSMMQALSGYENESQYTDLYARTYFYKGDVFFSQKKYQATYALYYKAREIINKKNDPCIVDEYSNRLAAVTLKLGKYIQAAEFYKQTVNDISKCTKDDYNRFSKIQAHLDNVGICYVRAGMVDSADLYFAKALAYIKKYELQFPDHRKNIDEARAIIYGNQAGVAISRNQLGEAERLLNYSISITEMPGVYPEDAALDRLKLIQVYLKQGRYAEAKKSLQLVSKANESFHNIDIDLGYQLFQSKIFQQEGNYPKAYTFLENYRLLKDSLNNQINPANSQDMQQSIDYIEQQNSVQNLTNENKINLIFLRLFILIIVLTCIIIVLIAINARRSKLNLQKVVNLNKEITRKSEELMKTLSALEQSHNNNAKLLKAVAHDLRGPLGAITSIAELSVDGHLEEDNYKEVMALIYRSGTKALTLANELLTDIDREGKIILAEPLNVEEQLKNCIDLYQNKISLKQQNLVINTIPAIVMGDQEKFWRVFSNLISNAVKFSKPGGTITINMLKENETVIVSIHDNGIGIPEDLIDRIFEPTAATTREGTMGEPSFGMGLSITKQIVESHQGRIWIESSAEKGTTFYVAFPLV